MYTTLTKDAKSIRQKLIKGTITVDSLMKREEDFVGYAKAILKQDRDGKGIDKELRDALEDVLMICLDVYTYSEEGNVLIPDYVYDMLMNLYCFLNSCDRLVYSDYITGTTIWPFVKHEAPFMVGTINNKIYSVDELDTMLREYKGLGYRRLLYAPKFDGISSAVTKRNGVIEKAVTRNNGVEGKDITPVIKAMERKKGIFKELPDGYYKCELVCTTKDFEDLCKLKPYANRRSAAAAITGTPSNIAYAEFLTAIPLAWVNFDGTRMKYLAWQYCEGWVTETNCFETEVVYRNIENILHHIRDASYPVRVDGVVIFPIHNGEDEPNTHDLMAACLAYKVNTQEAITHIEYVYNSVGRMGLCKPMAKVEPCEVNETIVNDVSLGSLAKFAALCLHEHEEVVIFSAGDVIPQLRLPEERNYPKNAKKLRLDPCCPYCGKKLHPKYSDADLYCTNMRCPRVLSGKVVNFLDKLDVCDGFRDATFLKLAETGLVKCIPDLFTLHKFSTKLMNTIGTYDGEKLLEGIKEMKKGTYEVSTIIGAMGIDNIAAKTCQNIFRNISLDELLDLKKSQIHYELLGLPGVGSVTARNLAEWLNENRDFMEFLRSEMHIVDDTISHGNVCFTGFRNKDYQEIFKKMGFPVNDRVTKESVACVYAGDPTTSNANSAIKRGIPLINFSDIDTLVDKLQVISKNIEERDMDYRIGDITREIFRSVPHVGA